MSYTVEALTMAKTTDFHAFVPGLGTWCPPPACHPSLDFRQVQISSTRIVPVSVMKAQTFITVEPNDLAYPDPERSA